jgi:hypothetical protein
MISSFLLVFNVWSHGLVGEESRGSSGRGMGAMMLANLHGLTRSRPDLLRQGVIGYIVHIALVHPSGY